ncbi:FtsX-like permease family protein [Bifidobacterium sp. ESL0784]|uniref:ABC transporter permease n=1 Tax=Bifidobacterium sp. ESL0784 TaxID=2983231 RepID=UPI0023F63734|nr:ABC transporter permease [Bifidobacterium sp. ESL0784]MDF7640237.1 FtsX-like permease family protein [Bifidobacterium sp. ESL0784]
MASLNPHNAIPPSSSRNFVKSTDAAESIDFTQAPESAQSPSDTAQLEQHDYHELEESFTTKPSKREQPTLKPSIIQASASQNHQPHVSLPLPDKVASQTIGQHKIAIPKKSVADSSATDGRTTSRAAKTTIDDTNPSTPRLPQIPVSGRHARHTTHAKEYPTASPSLPSVSLPHRPSASKHISYASNVRTTPVHIDLPPRSHANMSQQHTGNGATAQSHSRRSAKNIALSIEYRNALPLKRHKISHKMLWLDIKRSLGKSVGRFISIVCMVALGSFALVGLSVTGPDMRSTADHYFSEHHLADISVIGKTGFDDSAINAINGTQDVTKVEYGSFKDVAVKHHDDSVRIFSSTKSISSYEVRKGRMPHKPNEIALDEHIGNSHHIGSTISFDEKPDAAGHTMLKHTDYKVTGIVRSPEIISPVNHGQSDSGSGSLDGYAVVVPQAFNPGPYNIARLRYNVLDSLPDHFSDAYVKKMHREKDILNDDLDNRGTDLSTDTSQQTQTASQSNSPMQQTVTKPSPALYQVLSRAEVPGGTGYNSYETISRVIDSLATIFPIFMYLIAALLTFTSMTRFVEEDRINVGTLKALGYTNKDVIKKFLVYGCTAGIIGGLVGALAGEFAMPKIFYKAYGVGFAVPVIAPQFNWTITLLSLVLALAVTVLPAYIAAHRELKEHTRTLLSPKPPVSGSSIALEKIKWLWNALNFKYKITMRNIFRYRMRTLMTIVGVCGSMALLVAGIGVQHSIGTITDLQYKDGIIDYDLIAAQRPDIKPDQQTAINKKLHSTAIKNYKDIHYEHTTMNAGPRDSKQDITLIAVPPKSNLDGFVRLQERTKHTPLALKNTGAVISEHLSKMTGAGVGDDIIVKDSEGNTHVVPISGICEMYIGHFIFMSSNAYEKIFHEKYVTNATMTELKDRSPDNARHEAAQFMHIDGIASVAQNSMFINQTQVLANALTILMEVLTLASILLEVVILYNLNNLNLSERVRELSTIKVLGYSNAETTLYIYRETIMLSVLGIVTGIGLGMGLHRIIIGRVAPNTMMFDPKFTYSEFIVPLVIIVLVAFVLGLYVMRRICQVDMLKALQARE